MKIIIYIDSIPIYVQSGTTILQACELIGIVVPRFCYHDLLNIVGNCRMCLVEVESVLKPQISCGFPVVNNIRIYTNSPLVKKARESVLEFLLLNHPLDCPICDQGGECDLQTQFFQEGSLFGRFDYPKRSVEDKEFGPVIKTIITRCIHCTRCIRFAINIAGVHDLGITLRGSKSEVGLYVDKPFNSEVSGNIIDLCPVGALTLKTHAFKTRPWEAKITKNIDLSDNLGSHILIESKDGKAIKVIVRPCLSLNEEWITDKARFAYEGFTNNRLVVAYWRFYGFYKQFECLFTANCVAYNFMITKKWSKFIFGRNLDIETLFLGSYLCKKLGWDYISENRDCFYPLHSSLFQSTISLSDFSKIKSCLLVGINPRFECSISNLKLHTQTKAGKLDVFHLGCANNLQYKRKNLGLSLYTFLKIISGISHFSKYLFGQYIFIYGDTLSQRIDAHSGLIFSIFSQNLKKLNLINLFRFSIGGNSIGISFQGFFHKASVLIKHLKQASIYTLGLQTSTLVEFINSEEIIFENSHFTPTNVSPLIVFPLQTVYEKIGTFINFQGTLQNSIDHIVQFGQEPFYFLKILYFSYIQDIFDKIKLFCFNSKFSYTISQLGFFFVKCYQTPLKVLLIDFYITNIVDAHSITLSKLSKILRINYWAFNDPQII